MKVSELIERLQKIKDEHGDLPVYITWEWTELIRKVDYYGEYPDPYFPERVEIE